MDPFCFAMHQICDAKTSQKLATNPSSSAVNDQPPLVPTHQTPTHIQTFTITLRTTALRRRTFLLRQKSFLFHCKKHKPPFSPYTLLVNKHKHSSITYAECTGIAHHDFRPRKTSKVSRARHSGMF